MKQSNNIEEEQTRSDVLNFVTDLRRFIINIIDERIKQNEKKRLEPEKEKPDLIFYTIKEVCEKLKIGRTSLYSLCHIKKSLKFHRIGGRILFSHTDIIIALTTIKTKERLS